MTANTLNIQTNILNRALSSTSFAMTTDVANYFMSIRLEKADEQRANQLAEKARAGLLSDPEQAEIDEYRRIGRIIEMLKLRAKAVLTQTG